MPEVDGNNLGLERFTGHFDDVEVAVVCGWVRLFTWQLWLPMAYKAIGI